MSALPANPLRGEANVRIGKVEFRIAVTFAGLIRLSESLGTRTLDDLYVRLLGFEPKAVVCAIRCLTVAEDDDQVAALSAKILDEDNISTADQLSWVQAIEKALSAHVDAGKRLRDGQKTVEIAETAVMGNQNSLS